MQKCYRRYLADSFLDKRDRVVVFEMGSADVNGGYREIFCHPKIEYCGADLVDVKGVDLLLKSPYEIPLNDAFADVVISGQMLEHCARFWLSFQEMVRVLKPDGFLFVIAPSSGPVHRHPVDCYRFYPDAYQALADLAGCFLVDSWLDERGPWKDLVGVFAKRKLSKWSGYTESSRVPYQQLANKKPIASKDSASFNDSPRLNTTSGDMSYLRLLEVIHNELAPRLYLEIGVKKGASLKLANCRSIGVDPQPDLSGELPSSAQIYYRTSDEFFELDAAAAIESRIDFGFIDGMHHFEQALRDLINIERHASATSVIVVDDIFPNHPIQARRQRESRVWTGDVWKLIPCLSAYRSDLVLVPVNTSPAGSLLVAGLDEANRRLIDDYNPIVRQYVTDCDDTPPVQILQRHGAIRPDDPRVTALLRLLRQCREDTSSAGSIRERLKPFAREFVWTNEAR